MQSFSIAYEDEDYKTMDSLVKELEVICLQICAGRLYYITKMYQAFYKNQELQDMKDYYQCLVESVIETIINMHQNLS